MGQLHTKTMNRPRAALLEHDFVIRYKKGETMPADYLSRLPSTADTRISQITEGFVIHSKQTSNIYKKKTNHCKT